MTEFSVFMPLQGIAPRNSWTGGKIQNYMENENKIIFEDFNCTMDKMDRDSENKTQILLVMLQLCLVKTHRG